MTKEFLEPVYIEAFDINDAWFQLIWKAVETGRDYTITRGSYEGQKRKEFDYITVHIKKPGKRPLAPIIPEGSSLPAPTDDDKIQNYFLKYLYSDDREAGEEYTYGQRLVNPIASLTDEDLELKLQNVNQIDEVVRMYKKDGYGTNQATMEIAMPFDLKLPDPPCLRMIDTRISNGRLHFMVYFRSWDLVAGFPENLGGLQMLKEFMAAEIGVEDGELIASSKGLHIYDHFWDYAKIRTGKDLTRLTPLKLEVTLGRERPSKDRRFYNIALMNATAGTCRIKNFGAIIVKDSRIKSTGYSGAPKDTINCIDLEACHIETEEISGDQNHDQCFSLHAEENAIIQASIDDMIGSTMYIAGIDMSTGEELKEIAKPCKHCRGVIINADIEKVIVPHEDGFAKLLVEDWKLEARDVPASLLDEIKD